MSQTTPVDLRVLLELAWPVVIARSSQAVIGFCDALMTAPLGESPLAAVTTGSMNTFSALIFPMGLVFIAQSFSSQLQGRGRLDDAVRYAWYALILSGIAMAIAIASVPVIPYILSLFEFDAQVFGLMTIYLQIRMFSIGPAVGTEALGNWYGGIGITRLHMIAGLVAMVFNVFLNWVLIYGHLGAPALGVAGAALASVAASWIGFGVIALLFAQKRGLEAVASIRPRALRMGEFVRMLRFGAPHGLNWFLEFSAFTIFLNVVVAGLGTTVLAAMMVVFNINSVSFMPAFGIMTAGAILTGQAIGRDEPERVGKIVGLTLKVAIAWQCSIGVIYFLFPAQLMRWFASDDAKSEELMAIGAVLLAMSAAWQLFDATCGTFAETLRSAGDTTWTMWARLTVAWVVFVPASYLTVVVWEGGHVAAMACIIGYLASLAVIMMLRFRNGAWRRIDMTGQDAVLTSV